MDSIEVVPGVVIEFDDDSPGLYISDEQGEICCWIFEEIEEDPAAWTASLHAVAMAASLGPASVRAWIEKGGYTQHGFNQG